MSAAITVASVLVLIALNAFYVAAEFAIVAARPSVLKQQAATGDRIAGRVARIAGDRLLQDRYIATAQLGITLASLGLGMYGEHRLSGWIFGLLGGGGLPTWLASHALASTLALAALTYLHIVLGEMIPKAIALAHPERAARWLMPVMAVSGLVAWPLVRGLNGVGNRLLRALRLPLQGSRADQSPSPEELRYIVRESGEQGLIRPEAAEVLEDLIEFGQLTAGEIMVPRVRVRGIEFGCQADELRAIIRKTPHTRYPVYAGSLDRIVGTVHIKDILKRTRQGKTLLQSDVRPVPFVPETSTLDKTLAAMRARRTQMAVVMDEHGGTAGILSMADLFEEVVGDIEDIGGGHHLEIARTPDGTLLVDGTARLAEVGEVLGLDVEHEAVDTVSGLVLALLERPPQPGDSVLYRAVRFEVVAIEGHGVARCLVVPGEARDAPELGLRSA